MVLLKTMIRYSGYRKLQIEPAEPIQSNAEREMRVWFDDLLGLALRARSARYLGGRSDLTRRLPKGSE